MAAFFVLKLEETIMKLNIDSMKAEQATIKEKIKAIAKKEADGEELSDEEINQFVELEGDFEALEAKIKRAEYAEKMEAKTAKEEQVHVDVIGHVEKPLAKGESVAIMTRALLANKAYKPAVGSTIKRGSLSSLFELLGLYLTDCMGSSGSSAIISFDSSICSFLLFGPINA